MMSATSLTMIIIPLSAATGTGAEPMMSASWGVNGVNRFSVQIMILLFWASCSVNGVNGVNGHDRLPDEQVFRRMTAGPMTQAHRRYA